MPTRTRFACLLFAALLPATDAMAATPAPSPTDAIFRPVFATPQGPLSAGTAFVGRLARCKEPVLLTATHLFGPDGGLHDVMAPDDLLHGVSQVELTGLGPSGKHMMFSVSSLTPDDAKPCCDGKPMHGTGDVAAFTAPDRLLPIALPIATQGAVPGQRVTLLAALVEGTDNGLRHDATILGMDGGMLFYKFDDPTIALRATSGAPVVDADGRVVAINLSSGYKMKSDPGAMVGGGNPVAAWRDAVETACQPPTQK